MLFIILNNRSLCLGRYQNEEFFLQQKPNKATNINRNERRFHRFDFHHLRCYIVKKKIKFLLSLSYYYRLLFTWQQFIDITQQNSNDKRTKLQIFKCQKNIFGKLIKILLRHVKKYVH